MVIAILHTPLTEFTRPPLIFHWTQAAPTKYRDRRPYLTVHAEAVITFPAGGTDHVVFDDLGEWACYLERPCPRGACSFSNHPSGCRAKLSLAPSDIFAVWRSMSCAGKADCAGIQRSAALLTRSIGTRRLATALGLLGWPRGSECQSLDTCQILV